MRVVITTAAALALAACGAEDSAVTGNQAANAANTAAPQAAPAVAATPEQAAAPVAAPSAGLDPAFLAGRWTETGNCAEEAIEFRPDGSFTFPWGEEGQWTLEGSRLAMVGNPQPIDLEIVSPDEMRATKATGTVRRWQRCA